MKWSLRCALCCAWRAEMNTTLAKRKCCGVLANFLLMAGVMLVIVALTGVFAVPAVFATEAGMMRSGQDAVVAHGFVIRLASTRSRFTADDIDELDISPGNRVYTTSFKKDGTQWQQLRLGFFDTRADALAALKKIEAGYPDAQVAPVTSADRRSSPTVIPAGRSAAQRAPVQEVVRAETPAAQHAISPTDTTHHRVSSLFGKFSPSNWFGGISGDESAASPVTQASAASGYDKDAGAGESAVTGSLAVSENTQASHGTYTVAPVKESPAFSGFRKLSPAGWFSNKTREDMQPVAPAQQGGMVKVAAATPAAVGSGTVVFDHASTGFVLEGAHAAADCSSCHLQGVFKGTPTQCNTCHAPGSRMSGQSMPAGHIKTTPMCEECHSSQQWTPLVRMNHDVVSGSCSSCHDGKNATGKSSVHISSGNDCETCHTTFSWITSIFDHSGVAPGTCFTCHNGTTATGKTPSHIASSNTCDDCHNTSSFTSAVFDHSGVTGNCSSCHNGTTATGRNSTHIQTTSVCEDCHGTTSFSPALRVDHADVLGTCFSCHNGTTATGKTPNHIASSNTCDDCHNTSSFTSAVFDHSGVTGNCSSCHNGTTATGKNSTHIQTTSACEDCHGTTSFSPALRVDHADVLGTCYSCHNGVTAPGKTATHLATSNTCDDCHTTNAWIPAVFDHAGVTSPCSTCHNGTTATGKPLTHIQTSGQCDDCHTTIAWIPASFDHSLVTGSCSSCHNGSTATGKPSSHFVTSLQCDDCHGISNWTPLIFSHSSGTYPGDHSGNPPCTACHTSNNQVIPWPSPAYQPDCAGCHANDYNAGEHRNRSVSLDRDCGASGCHRVSSSSW